MALTADEILDVVSRLDHAEKTGEQTGLLSLAFPEIDMDDSYSIQEEWVRRKCARGDSIVGWKIGLTSKAMQAALNIDIPDSGPLLRSMVFEAPAVVPRGRFIQPRVEAELAFVMKSRLAGGNLSRDDILSAIDYAVPALEILDTRIVRKDHKTGRTRTVFDTIADNAANAGIVTGRPVAGFRDVDLRWIGAILSRDGDVEETGLAAGVLNDPITAVAWLAKRLHIYGQSIEPGQLVLSGSFIRPVEAPPGSLISGDFGPYGIIECRFAD
ncbi:2-oxo-hept-4-ene-1,7-dioate hydratase [Chelatococcus asaccharovorans]|uniref:2-oxo-hept-4-ene-1,7-dioate hydratase n=1 Tax=Chelatococcus asaccharovorans TaxID=28210 RepID=UPI00224C7659|nr:2-oxo-hepta-3-ene-1,7-dioic acid hydratase [Chelatococcus asaccharovorans]CAH1653344.1 2-oxo-hept-4-ene-1,7-dioate hydratase [Chelatococcus asaccharovorans]CAH1686073.1 2-oxo-hept-4-ene-1,7-dioate hydratase [Chelatococcus asaccharovorans]